MPPRPPTSTLFPYTTLFRSAAGETRRMLSEVEGKKLLAGFGLAVPESRVVAPVDRKSTRLNSSHSQISYAVFCLKKKTACQWVPVPRVAERALLPALRWTLQ